MSSIYIDAQEIPTTFIQATIKDISFQPAVDLSSICEIVARDWAKTRGTECYWHAILQATSWEEWGQHSVSKRYHCAPVEQVLESLGYKFIGYESRIYYYKGSRGKVTRWLNDDFRGTMENPY